MSPKVILITGASSGFGALTVRALADAKHPVCAGMRDIRGRNADAAGRFGLQDVIWRGTCYTPSGPQSSRCGHYDHVHITTTPRR